MAALNIITEETLSDPLDLMEQIAGVHGWLFERTGDRDVAIEARGQWCDYRMFATWHDEGRALLFACAFDMRVAEFKRRDVVELLARINEKLLIGHFDIWTDDGMPVFRHAVLLRGMSGATVEQVEDMIDIALAESERFYPALQFVIWGGKSPADAIEAALFETSGEA